MTVQPKPTAADVLRKHYATQRTIFPNPPIPSCTCGWTAGMNRRDFPQHQADMLAAAGLLATAPCCPPSPEEVANGWLVERHTHCTCGGGPPFGHEPGCGLVPLAPLSEVKGMAEHDAQVLRDAARYGREYLGEDGGADSAWLYLDIRAEQIAGGGVQ